MMSIQSEHIFFRYGKRQVLANLSFTAPGGKITYLAGKNGCGKTTWILLSAGLLKLKQGMIRFGGKSFAQVRPNVSISFDTSPLYPGLSLRDNLQVLYGVDTRSREILTFLYDYGFSEDLLRQKASRLSYGQKHRAGIAGALLRNTEYLILDEPDLGLDPVAWEKTADRLAHMRDEGKCILLTGQHFETLAPLVDEICVLGRGRALYEGAKADFLREWSPETHDLKTGFEKILAVCGSGQAEA